MGAWIEIEGGPDFDWHQWVAPFMGAWIEISGFMDTLNERIRRTFYGCVD